MHANLAENPRRERSARIRGVSEPLCVYCRKRPPDPRWRPFCSERCKLFDLADWADGTYRVPGERVEERRDDDEQSQE